MVHRWHKIPLAEIHLTSEWTSIRVKPWRAYEGNSVVSPRCWQDIYILSIIARMGYSENSSCVIYFWVLGPIFFTIPGLSYGVSTNPGSLTCVFQNTCLVRSKSVFFCWNFPCPLSLFTKIWYILNCIRNCIIIINIFRKFEEIWNIIWNIDKNCFPP